MLIPSVPGFPPEREGRGTHCVGNARKIKSPGHPTECLHKAGLDCARARVIDDDDAFRGDGAFRHLEGRGDRAVGKQFFSTAQRYRKYLQPEGIDQIMFEECLHEIGAAINVQIPPGLLLNFGDFFRDVSA